MALAVAGATQQRQVVYADVIVHSGGSRLVYVAEVANVEAALSAESDGLGHHMGSDWSRRRQNLVNVLPGNPGLLPDVRITVPV